MIDRLKLLDAILDNKDADEEVLIKAVEDVIAEGIGFDHDNGNLRKACHVELTEKQKSTGSTMSKSRAIEMIEKTFNKREITLMMVLAVDKQLSL